MSTSEPTTLHLELFDKYFGAKPAHTAFAPGRIEFIGNHNDYNGGPVLGAAIAEGITAMIAPREDDIIQLASEGLPEVTRLKLSEVRPLTGESNWANYPLGVLHVLREAGMPLSNGFDICFTSNLPSGAGMSSSAALELATAYALAAMTGFETTPADMARWGRKAENEFVGMPCGILDQGVSAHGEADHLVHIDCHVEAFSTIPMPPSCHFWIFNSGKKHALIDSFYSTRHDECMQAWAILKELNPDAACLAHIKPEQVEAARSSLKDDIYKRAIHITEESERVRQCCNALREGDMATVGKLVTASHRSSQYLFENSITELNFLVDVLEAEPSVYGARLTGGGFGGAVMAVTSSAFNEANAAAVTRAFKNAFHSEPSIFHTQTGPGARVV